MRKSYFSVVLTVFVASPCLAVDCNGFLYRSKRDAVPIFDEPTTTGRVVHRLKIGEEICYVGEEGEFAIIDWRASSEQDSKPVSSSDKPALVFARTVDLWEPKDDPRANQQSGLFHTLKSYYYYLRSGGVPEDALLPYRPFIQDLATPGASSPSVSERQKEEQINK